MTDRELIDQQRRELYDCTVRCGYLRAEIERLKEELGKLQAFKQRAMEVVGDVQRIAEFLGVKKGEPLHLSARIYRLKRKLWSLEHETAHQKGLLEDQEQEVQRLKHLAQAGLAEIINQHDPKAGYLCERTPCPFPYCECKKSDV
jgi:hypothetical protein